MQGKGGGEGEWWMMGGKEVMDGGMNEKRGGVPRLLF